MGGGGGGNERREIELFFSQELTHTTKEKEARNTFTLKKVTLILSIHTYTHFIVDSRKHYTHTRMLQTHCLNSVKYLKKETIGKVLSIVST